MSYILGQEEIEAIAKVIQSGALDRYLNSPSVSTQFEREFQELIEARRCLAVSSGTAALICGLTGMQVGPGDEVIVPAFTYVATPLSVLAVGATPVLVEIDETLTIDPEDISRAITPKTRAIIPVHMHGLPCDMARIMEIAEAHGLSVLEDVAQACGGSYRGRRLGSIGHAGAFSFNHFKIITCGEGGALVSNEDELMERAMLYHHGGYLFDELTTPVSIDAFPGINYRISEIASAMLRVQLGRLDGILHALRREKTIITESLANSGLSIVPTYDDEGDCGRDLLILFKTKETAHRFVNEAAERQIGAWLPGMTGHIHTEWEPILGNKVAYSGSSYADSCPRTRDLIDRTVCVVLSVHRAEPDSRELAQRIATLGRKVQES